MTCEKSEFLKADGTRRVVITGMGAISPAGTGVDALWNAVYSGKQCIAPITRFDASEFAGSLAAEVPNFDAAACGMSKKEARRFALFVQYAIAASEERGRRQASTWRPKTLRVRHACGEAALAAWRNSNAVATRFRRRAPSA